MPVFKVPIHLSYILYLGCYSRFLAMTYFRFAITLCRMMRVQPSLLLHPLDFMSSEDNVGLEFFPAMSMPLEKKLKLATGVIDYYRSKFQVGTMRDHALGFGSDVGEKIDAPKKVATDSTAAKAPLEQENMQNVSSTAK